MDRAFLQTVLTGCSWCTSVINVDHVEKSSEDLKDPVLLTHGICQDCSDLMTKELEESED